MHIAALAASKSAVVLALELPPWRAIRVRDIPGIELGLALVAAYLLVCVAMFAFELVARRRVDRSVVEDIRCPADGRVARVVFRVVRGEPMRDVIACSRLKPAADVRCDKACLQAQAA